MAKLLNLKAVTNRFTTTCKIFYKRADRIAEKPYVKINFDDLTRSIVAKVGAQKDLTHFTGLINFRSGQMHLMELGKHETLAQQKDLYENIMDLKDGWYGFTVYWTELKSGLLKVSPCSGQFGGIPIEYSSIFENYMKKLFGSKAAKISFHQLKYERSFPEDKEARLIAVLRSKNKVLVRKSMSDYQLSKLIPIT
jgi:hypothetical protein